MFNKITLIGRLGQHAEAKTSGRGGFDPRWGEPIVEDVEIG